jgi:hypothetical protein
MLNRLPNVVLLDIAIFFKRMLPLYILKRIRVLAGASAAVASILSLVGIRAVPAQTTSNPAYRLQVHSKATSKLPATQNWTLDTDLSFLLCLLPLPGITGEGRFTSGETSTLIVTEAAELTSCPITRTDCPAVGSR